MDFEEFGFDEGRNVTIHRLGDSTKGKDLVIPNSWNFAHLLKQAAQKLGMEAAIKVFNKDGTEVTDLDLIGQDDILYFADAKSGGAHTGHTTRAGGKGSSGMELVGNYYLGRFLGKGAFGEVRIAYHRISGEEFAVKFIKKDGIKDFQNAERMSAEIMALTVLRHPNVLHMYEVFDTTDSTCYVMEYVPGGDLLNYIVEHGALDEYTMFKYLHQIISAVEYCHGQNIIHRDLKLENILLDKDQKNIKIADFGLCGVVLPDPTDDQGGTRAYSAPELFQGKTGITAALDIWSIGVIIYALLYGKLPFNAENGPVLVDNIVAGKYHIPHGSISPGLQDLISRMLTVSIKKRATIVDIHCHPWVQQMRRRVVMERTEANRTQGNGYDAEALDALHNLRSDDGLSPSPPSKSLAGDQVGIGLDRRASFARRRTSSITNSSATTIPSPQIKADTRQNLPEIVNKGPRRQSKSSTGTPSTAPRPPPTIPENSGPPSLRKKTDYSSDMPIKPRLIPDVGVSSNGPTTNGIAASIGAALEKSAPATRKRGVGALQGSPAGKSSVSQLPDIGSAHNNSSRSSRNTSTDDWKSGYKGYVQGYRRTNQLPDV
eukprot:TRINITY_DN927_c0_g2_i1.p1 TRINITY_DN927_c0_g2~~TRINITY_DN927_c0_g2_i1.p1  ORF type:complete len:601 (-),score=145.89 TRINITY_DN927_c0_g2_i1:609-2411(-)